MLETMASQKDGFQFRIFTGLIRSLFARWNFFDRVAYHFELDFRLTEASGWERISFDLRRRPLGLLLNPEATFAHAQGNLLEHFALDVQSLVAMDGKVDSADVDALTTFRMIKALVETKLRAAGAPSEIFQFRLSARDDSGEFPVYVSDWLKAEPS